MTIRTRMKFIVFSPHCSESTHQDHTDPNLEPTNLPWRSPLFLNIFTYIQGLRHVCSLHACIYVCPLFNMKTKTKCARKSQKKKGRERQQKTDARQQVHTAKRERRRRIARATGGQRTLVTTVRKRRLSSTYFSTRPKTLQWVWASLMYLAFYAPGQIGSEQLEGYIRKEYQKDMKFIIIAYQVQGRLYQEEMFTHIHWLAQV